MKHFSRFRTRLLLVGLLTALIVLMGLPGTVKADNPNPGRRPGLCYFTRVQNNFPSGRAAAITGTLP